MTIVRIRHGEGRYTGIIMVEVKRGARGGIWWSRVATFPTVEQARKWAEDQNFIIED
jgi:hypothetical protein